LSEKPPRGLLAIDAAGPRAGVAVLGADGAILFRRIADARTGLTEILPALLQAAVAEAKGQIDAVAVSIGPGSFTGLRNAISLAQGYAAASGIALLGVPVAEAFAAAFPAMHRPLWVAIRARKGRLFILHDGAAEAYADADIPRTRAAIALAGDAAPEVAARLAAAGHDVLLTNARLIDPVWVARAAMSRQQAGLPPHPAQPIYVDPPEAKQPAGGLRPEPV
jgi:tRNA threonylcarbamoyl adenosine modification protein YeaZ